MDDIKIATALELISMLQKAVDTYGDRPVKVNVNNHNYIVNDLEFTDKGNVYTLVYKD